jgi:hypothetical protein
MTGGDWQKKGVGHEVFNRIFDWKRGGHLKMLVQKGGGGPVIYYSGEKFDM